MTDELDLRLSAAFRSLDLPAADPRLADTLRALRAAALDGRSIGGASRQRPNRIALLGLAASILVAVAVLAAMFGVPSIGPTPSPSPTPLPAPSETAVPTPTPDATGWPAFTVATLLAAREAGDDPDEAVVVLGWWSDMRADTACGTPPPSPLIIGCGDGQFGLTDAEVPIGTWDGETFVPTDGPAFTPLLSPELPTPGLGRSLIGLRDADGEPHPPVSVTLVGHFDDPRAATCPEALRQACLDRFVIDEIIWAQVSIPTFATPDPAATAPAPDAPPPASWPQIVDQCREPPYASEPGDANPRDIVEAGWQSFELLDVQPLTIELMAPMAPEWVYVVVTEPDVPISDRRPDPDGSARTFRYHGQAVCIGWNGMQGLFHSTVPGTTYQLWSDGERVELPVFPPEP